MLKFIKQKLFLLNRYNPLQSLQLFKMNIPEKQIMQQIYQKINKSVLSCYDIPHTKKYLNSLPIDTLLDQSVIAFVGSVSRPKNKILTEQLLDMAQDSAHKNPSPYLKQQQINTVQFFRAYFQKINAIQTGNTQEFNDSSNLLMQLAQQNHSPAKLLLAKQLYQILQQQSSSTSQNTLINSPQQLFKKANQSLQLLESSIVSSNLNGLTYVGLISEGFERLTLPEKQLQEIYMYSVVFSGNPIAMFRYAQLHKQKNKKIYLKYLKQAAENGVIEAQHNLGIEYIQGNITTKDQVKAFAWFVQASVHNYVYSKYNAGLILSKGTECGRIKPNPQAALVYFEQIHRSGVINVEKEIQYLMGLLGVKKQGAEGDENINIKTNMKTNSRGKENIGDEVEKGKNIRKDQKKKKGK